MPQFGRILPHFSPVSIIGERQIILNEKHLLRLLEDYVAYYNEDRNHYSLDKDPPISRPVLEKESEDDTVIALPRVGGLHHKYIWEKAA